MKKYGTVAVENLSLAVRAGTMFGFLGPQRFRQEHHHRLHDRPARPYRGEIELLGQRFDADNAASSAASA